MKFRILKIHQKISFPLLSLIIINRGEYVLYTHDVLFFLTVYVFEDVLIFECLKLEIYNKYNL